MFSRGSPPTIIQIVWFSKDHIKFQKEGLNVARIVHEIYSYSYKTFYHRMDTLK